MSSPSSTRRRSADSTARSEPSKSLRRRNEPGGAATARRRTSVAVDGCDSGAMRANTVPNLVARRQRFEPSVPSRPAVSRSSVGGMGVVLASGWSAADSMSAVGSGVFVDVWPYIWSHGWLHVSLHTGTMTGSTPSITPSSTPSITPSSTPSITPDSNFPPATAAVRATDDGDGVRSGFMWRVSRRGVLGNVPDFVPRRDFCPFSAAPSRDSVSGSGGDVKVVTPGLPRLNGGEQA